MRKLILAMILGLAAVAAKADIMLYWTIDTSGKEGGEAVKSEDAKYAVLYGYAATDPSDLGNNLDIYTALDAVVDGGAIDTKVTWTLPDDRSGEYDYFIVRLFNADTVNGTVNTYVSEKYAYQNLAANLWATDMLSMKATTAAAFGNFRAVPEPTSGLLLLLGVAGLALKRKRA